MLPRLIVLLALAGGGYYAYIKYYRKPAPPAPDGATATAPAEDLVAMKPPVDVPTTTGPADSQPTMTRPSADGQVQALVMAPIDVPPADQVEAVFQEGMTAWQTNDLLKARNTLNRVLHAAISPERQAQVREALNQIADKTIFSADILSNDPLVGDYVVVQGDNLQKIARQYKITEDLISIANNGMNKNFIRLGQRLKVINGPFHATVVKSSFDMHLYLQNVYVRTYKVALGADNSTPTGKWVVCTKQENPTWTNPRTGQRIPANDPQNPLGEFWIGLDGLEGKALGQSGYGIHGTIDEGSIGTNASMGCVRLAPKDIEVAYAMLVPGSTVTIVD